MDQIQSIKAELRLRHWAKVIAECQASTQTVKAWCEANDIHIKTYLRPFDCSSTPRPCSADPNSPRRFTMP